MKLTVGKITVILLSVLLVPFICAYAVELWRLVGRLTFSSATTAGFLWAFLGMGAVTFFMISAHNFFSILNHELTHNFWAVLSFSRPKVLQVREGRGGNFAFSGRKNIMTVLSPYFFPLLTAFIFPLYFVISGEYLFYYFIALGLSFGYSFVTELKQIHLGQSDLYVYGLVPSFIVIVFFQIVILGFLFAFLLSRFGGVSLFFKSGFFAVADLVKSLL